MTYVMSDIHGFLKELDEALSRIDLSEDVRLVLLGDYIDYGPDSGGVLRRVWDLQKMCGAITRTHFWSGWISMAIRMRASPTSTA